MLAILFFVSASLRCFRFKRHRSSTSSGSESSRGGGREGSLSGSGGNVDGGGRGGHGGGRGSGGGGGYQRWGHALYGLLFQVVSDVLCVCVMFMFMFMV